MKIIILGAGQVGSTLAASLSSEANDITIVDTNTEFLRDLQEHLDLRVISGNASHPDILTQAGAEDADMVIAVTNSDEVNMIACQVAYTLFHTPTKIARVRSPEYLKEGRLFHQEALPIDVLISPEQIVTDSIHSLIDHPGALQVTDFAGGRVKLVAVRAYYGGPLVGNELHTITEHMPGIEVRVAAIFRRNRPIIPKGRTVVEADDEVFFIAAEAHIRAVTSELRQREKRVRRIMIAGGGNIGTRLARSLEKQYQVKLIERNPEQAACISESLNKTVILQGDCADQDLLTEENIHSIDVFCAVTNDDQANILAAMLAKRLGANKVLALINRASYVELIQGGEIDIAVSPQQVTIGSLLAHVRRGDVVKVHSLRRGAAEAIEAVAHGDRHTSRVVGRRIDQIDLPSGTTIGAIVRGDEVLMAHHDIVIMAEDHVILFLIDRNKVSAVEKLFQVGINFF